MSGMRKEELAEKVGVTRQAVAKWEAGETMPDLEKSRMIAEIFDVSLDELANYEPDEACGLSIPPKGKHIFGVVTVGEKGQIVIPAKARKIFDIAPGDHLIVLGDEGQGIALIKEKGLLGLISRARRNSEGAD